MASIPIMKPTATKDRDQVYVATVPLRATRGPAQVLMSTAYSLNFWDLQHFMVLIQPSSLRNSKVLVFDFQPKDPENVFVALAALSGQAIPGTIRERKLGKLPKEKCWFVGFSEADTIHKAHSFNNSWKTDLRIGDRDCRHYTTGMVEHLTGKNFVLEQLRSATSVRTMSAN